MNLFGKLDAETIPSNPFFIEKGTYAAEVTKAEYRTSRDGQRQLFFAYTIDEPSSQYDNQTTNVYFDLVDDDMDSEKLALLPVDEQKKIRQTNAKIKRTLCGSDGNSSQKGLGVSADDLNSGEWQPSSVIGTKINMGITNYGTDGVNVQWINLREE